VTRSPKSAPFAARLVDNHSSIPATVTAPTVSGSEAVCPENRVKALDVLSWPRVGVRSPESPDRCWENRPRYDGKAVGTVVARYYDPTTAQFLTLDPDVATTLSPYGYVAGDPLNGGDPSGLCGWAPWDWLSCLVSNSIQSQNELAHPTWGQAAQNLLNAAAILNMEDGGGEAIEGCELATEGTSSLSLSTADTWGNPESLASHFGAHGADFGSTSADEYASQASQFLQDSQVDGLPTKIDAEGVIRVYDPDTNTFGAYNPDGTTRTFFQPTSPNYWAGQPGFEPWIPEG